MAAVSSVINSSFLRVHENRLLPLPLAPPPPPPSFQFHPNLNFPSLRIRCSSSSPFNDNTHISLNKTHSPHPTNPLACRFHASQFGGQESSNSYVETYAIGRHIRMSANKARRVAEQIRGRPYDETLMILELMPYRACEPILKLVFSAGANASNNLGLSKGSLIISNAVVDEGKTMKRMRAGARGRAHPIKKRTCHIKILVKGLPSESAVEAKPA